MFEVRRALIGAVVGATALATVLAFWGCGSSGEVGSSGVGAFGGASVGGGVAGASNEGGGGHGGGGVAGEGGQGGMGGQGGQGGGSTGNLNDPCNWGAVFCEPGLYCDAPGCGLGSCQAVLPTAAQQKTFNPVCGCNGISYYNPTISDSDGMAVNYAGVCGANDLVSCHQTSNPCTDGHKCNHEVANAAACLANPSATGSCWGLPLSCDPNGPQARGCLAPQACADTCSLMQGQNEWHQDMSCP